MAATKAQANWGTVAWNSITFTKVDSMTFSVDGKIEEYAGDLDEYATLMVALMTSVHATLKSTDPGNIMMLKADIGTGASLTATHKDAKLDTSGDIAYTLANAVLEKTDTEGSHAKYGTASASWRAFSSDGTTNPLTLTYTGG